MSWTETGKLVARSDDDPLLSLDPRLQVTFPKEGFYYIEVHDARFSAQAQNFYRLKTGSYEIVQDIFPLGGKRGETVQVSLSGRTVNADLTGANKAGDLCQSAGLTIAAAAVCRRRVPRSSGTRKRSTESAGNNQWSPHEAGRD